MVSSLYAEHPTNHSATFRNKAKIWRIGTALTSIKTGLFSVFRPASQRFPHFVGRGPGSLCDPDESLGWWSEELLPRRLKTSNLQESLRNCSTTVLHLDRKSLQRSPLHFQATKATKKPVERIALTQKKRESNKFASHRAFVKLWWRLKIQEQWIMQPWTHCTMIIFAFDAGHGFVPRLV